jgi:2-oxo-3-hexenedioate decarboxylase
MIGTPRQVDQASISTLIDELARFKVQLLHEDAIVAEGSGKNVLRSPALCLAELASAISKRTDVQPLSAGELVSSGTLTDSQLMAGGETWTARVSGLDLPALTIAT